MLLAPHPVTNAAIDERSRSLLRMSRFGHRRGDLAKFATTDPPSTTSAAPPGQVFYTPPQVWKALEK